MLLVVTSIYLALQGCDIKQGKPKVTDINNISEMPLTIKDLTTGVVYEKKLFPRPITSSKNEVSFYYSFFGKSQLIFAEMDELGVIYKYKINLNGKLEDMRRAIEEKISKENGKEIKFKCEAERLSYGGIDWEHNNCLVSSGSQRLTTKEKRPLSKKPVSASPSVWEQIHISQLVLEDVDLSAKAKREIEKKIQQKIEADKARAKNDV